MASFNRVVLLGNLTRDIELRYTKGGTAVTDIGLAVNDRRKSQTGEWLDETTFVDVTLWGRTAEVASEYLGKTSSILVEGRLKLDSWETEGQKRSKLRVVCDRMQLLGGPQARRQPEKKERKEEPKPSDLQPPYRFYGSREIEYYVYDDESSESEYESWEDESDESREGEHAALVEFESTECPVKASNSSTPLGGFLNRKPEIADAC